MRGNRRARLSPDVSTAARDTHADLGIGVSGELKNATMEQALYWQQIYLDIVAMEVKAMEVIQDLMARQSQVLHAGWN